jgi:hypothetical protein
MRTLIIRCPESTDHWKESWTPLPSQGFSLAVNERIVETSWEALAGDNTLSLKLKIFGASHLSEAPQCKAGNYLRASRLCYREIKIRVPISSLSGESSGTPESKYEVTSLTRFANTRLSVVDEKGALVVNTNRTPKYIKAWSWK